MRKALITGGVVVALALASACGPPQAHDYKPCPSANGEMIFTVTLPVARDEAEARICRPAAPQRMDVLVPPVNGGTAASQTEQINIMGGVQIANFAGDPTGYARGRTVNVDLIPLVG